MLDRSGPDPARAARTATRPGAAIVLAAGEGTRMRSAVPKVLHSIAGRSLLGHAVHAVAALEPEHLVVVVGHGGDRVSDAVTALGEELARPVDTAVQETRRGTGHAVQCGLAALPSDISGPVLITYGDVPLLEPSTLEALLATHADVGAAVTMLTSRLPDPSGYGRVLRGTDGGIEAIVEHADATAEQRDIQEINAAIYAFDAAFLRAAIGRLRPTNSKNELYLTDLIAMARAAGHAVTGLCWPDVWQSRGVNDGIQLAEARAELNRRVLRGWMLAGVVVVDPATTWIDVEVRLAPDVTVRPGTQLLGTTTVGGGADIGPDTTLTDCEIGAGASVVRTHGSGSTVGAGASVGPFAYLRPGVRLGERGKIGTFVEVKNSTIGEGTKVPHLTYVGDATIGDHSNIGASSTVVNYDGVRKHRTVIGSHVKTGSGTKFVAPVEVGDGAYTGAGAVVRQDVPPGALAVSGGPQRNIEGWVEQNRPNTPAADAARAAQDGMEAESR